MSPAGSCSDWTVGTRCVGENRRSPLQQQIIWMQTKSQWEMNIQWYTLTKVEGEPYLLNIAKMKQNSISRKLNRNQSVIKQKPISLLTPFSPPLLQRNHTETKHFKNTKLHILLHNYSCVGITGKENTVSMYSQRNSNHSLSVVPTNIKTQSPGFHAWLKEYGQYDLTKHTGSSMSYKRSAIQISRLFNHIARSTLVRSLQTICEHHTLVTSLESITTSTTMSR